MWRLILILPLIILQGCSFCLIERTMRVEPEQLTLTAHNEDTDVITVPDMKLFLPISDNPELDLITTILGTDEAIDLLKLWAGSPAMAAALNGKCEVIETLSIFKFSTGNKTNQDSQDK